MEEYEVRLPELGEDIEKASVSFWHVEEGDEVKQEDDLVEVLTEKSTFNVPAPVTGTISKILIGEGEEVKVGQVMVIINT